VASDRSIDAAAALRHWTVSEPWTVAVASAGANNTSLFVDTPGQRYVLRLYAQANPENIHFEHGLLAALEAADLPFSIPTPVRTSTGETFARVATGEVETLATLTPLLPGTHPEPDNPRHAQVSGEALGHLGRALAGMAPPPGRAQYVRFGDIRRFYPMLDDPEEAVHAIPALAASDRRRLRAMIADVEAAVPSLYANLPLRLTHRDYYGPNVLVTDDRVSALLDFEFAGEDLRALDFAVALACWPLWGAEDSRWPVCEAFARGYAAVEPLTHGEAEALPRLVRLQLATWLIHCAGRYRDGLPGSEDPLAFVVNDTLAYLDWSARNESLLTERLVRWVTGNDRPA
jgi:homoserine kinase type II